ncbi:DUF2501 domain-containing protein [Enterobacteriaceae bacterium BIT-l23]|uniref:DUF2501 domain-containing protein n=1 Tax=Jejubacter sp. L23 TaxID=3092086 RepID=UPI001585CC2A|nr:DUF2501 domain-containing protein [Enterobacteriaceae bacterium BIT-l23]
MKFMAKRAVYGAAMATMLVAGSASAANWQDQLSSAANELSSQSGSQGGASLSQLTGLLNGGNQALSSNSMTNAAGVMQYCAKQKLASVTSTDNIKSQLMNKLGLEDTQKQNQQQDYQQGLQGLLNTGNGQQLNLESLGNSQLAEKVKTKACDLVLKQGKQFLS